MAKYRPHPRCGVFNDDTPGITSVLTAGHRSSNHSEPFAGEATVTWFDGKHRGEAPAPRFALVNDDKPRRCPGWSMNLNGCQGASTLEVRYAMEAASVPHWIINLMPFKCQDCGIRTLPHFGVRLFFSRSGRALAAFFKR